MKSKVKNWIACVVGTGFGSGMVPFAPGTFGTVAAIPVFLFFFIASQKMGSTQSTRFAIYVVGCVLVFCLGVWAAGKCEKIYQVQDPGKIVIDEILGYLVTMTGLPCSWPWIIIGFVVFRILDILKIWPANKIDLRMHGGLGIMLDDVISGLQGMLILNIVQRLL